MKKKKGSKGLLLSVEKIRDLRPGQLAAAAGGCNPTDGGAGSRVISLHGFDCGEVTNASTSANCSRLVTRAA